MFEFMTAPLQPLCALEHAAGISNLGHLGEISCGMIKIEDLHPCVRFQRLPIARRPISDPHIHCLRIELLDMGDLPLHPLHKSGLSILQPTFRTPLVEVAYFTACLAN